MSIPNPFITKTTKNLVAIKGKRKGYLQIACPRSTEKYSEVPDEVFLAAKKWASILEDCGAKRVYWITLSEKVKHIHIHLYPRWSDDEEKGVQLFENRNNENQPNWSDEINLQLSNWANSNNFDVEVID
ncbi:MAG: hypothetical protein QNJ31_05580 [Candidatus Caenarcaniphilales bacterium]|nr:hypothetical protein [Candidatus Caenarcaniphilales bacterium]